MLRSAASVSVRCSSGIFATSCSRGSPTLSVCCSLVDASNADIAALVGAKIVLVANGGLGNSFDELQLNRTMCEKVGVEIAGVIINKVGVPWVHRGETY
jgi:dethiobiotin synthetase